MNWPGSRRWSIRILPKKKPPMESIKRPNAPNANQKRLFTGLAKAARKFAVKIASNIGPAQGVMNGSARMNVVKAESTDYSGVRSMGSSANPASHFFTISLHSWNHVLGATIVSLRFQKWSKKLKKGTRKKERTLAMIECGVAGEGERRVG